MDSQGRHQQAERAPEARRARPLAPRAAAATLLVGALLVAPGAHGAAEAGPAYTSRPEVAAHSQAVSPTVEAVGAATLGSPPASGSWVAAIAAVPNGRGYYVLRADGQVSAFGVPARGSVPGMLPAGVTATGITVDPATGGYWVVTSMGEVFSFDAPSLGSVHVHPGGWGQYPAAVGIAAAPRGQGYYVLRANGKVVAFGAPSYGGLAHQIHYGTTAPVVATAIAVDPATGGYYVLTSVGGVHAFHAPWLGSPYRRGGPWDQVQAAGISVSPDGKTYLVVGANGSIASFGEQSKTRAAPALPLGASATGAAFDPTTGGFWEAIDFTPVGGYLNPMRSVRSLVPQEIDQGVDYCGSGPVYALGPGVVLNTVNPGWPGGAFISYRLTGGPARGLVAYLAENVTPTVRVGEPVGPASVLGWAHDSGTCLETGWADLSDPVLRAAAWSEYTGKNSTAYGRNFSSLLNCLGTRPGLVQPDGPPGPLPADWPRW